MVIEIDERSDEHTFGYSSKAKLQVKKQVKFYFIFGNFQKLFCFIEYDCWNFFVIISVLSWFMCLIQ